MQEDSEQATTRYLNELYFQLQDELALVKVFSVDEAYQYALKVEKKYSRGKGKMVNRRGSSTTYGGRGSSSRSTENEEPELRKDMKPDFRGRGGFGYIGRRKPTLGSRKPLRCFICSEGHKAQGFP
eukprot:Gb_10811 [translate_table: standard]